MVLLIGLPDPLTLNSHTMGHVTQHMLCSSLVVALSRPELTDMGSILSPAYTQLRNMR